MAIDDEVTQFVEQGLFRILHQYDHTWHIARESEFAVLLENDNGQQVQASRLEVALRKALALVGLEMST